MNGVLTEGGCSSVHAAVSAVLQDFMPHNAEKHPAAPYKVNGVIEIETAPANGHIVNGPSFGFKESREVQLQLPEKAEFHGQAHGNPSEEGKTETCCTNVAMPCADANQQKVDDEIAKAIAAADGEVVKAHSQISPQKKRLTARKSTGIRLRVSQRNGSMEVSILGKSHEEPMCESLHENIPDRGKERASDGESEACLTKSKTKRKRAGSISSNNSICDTEPTGLPEKKQRIISIVPTNEVEQAAREKSLDKAEVQGSKEVQMTMKEKGEISKVPVSSCIVFILSNN